MSELIFGDPAIILDMARNTPHIIEIGHECNCGYCDNHEINKYRCSVCGQEEDELRDFKYPTGYKCTKCDVELMTPREYEDYVGAKKRQYGPLLIKQMKNEKVS